MKKRIQLLLFVCIIMAISIIGVYAESGSYNTWYDMKGGVYSQRTWNATNKPTFDVAVGQGESEYLYNTLYCYLERKTVFGWATDDGAQVEVVKGGGMILDGKETGTYRLYFRLGATGYRASGPINISWKW